MEPILVTGGTGHLGRDLVRHLLGQRRAVRVLGRSAGGEPAVEWVSGDLATGRGLADAVRDVRTVIHAATLSPIAKRGGMRPVDFFATPAR
jgi:nucleoside-diphosphate-sugar epimerase